jgi:hypothetical protein
MGLWHKEKRCDGIERTVTRVLLHIRQLNFIRGANMKAFIVAFLLVSAAVRAQPTISGCPVFPASNIWNTRIDSLPADPQSAAFVATMGGSSTHLRLDDVLPINTSPAEPLVAVGGLAMPGSDPGGYLIPPGVQIEAGSDAHALVVDTTNCILYEIYLLTGAPGAWAGGSGAKWDLRSNALRTDTWTSADAAGLPITAGVLRYDEVLSGQVNHALRMTTTPTLGFTYLWPARHYASHDTDSGVPQMGQRFRLQASFDISGFTPRMQVILQALKTYGAMVADNGLAWAMQHDQDLRWDPNELLTLHNIPGTNMEAVDATVLQVDPNSGATSLVPNSLFVSDALGRPNQLPLGSGLAVQNGVIVATGSGSGGLPGPPGPQGPAGPPGPAGPAGAGAIDVAKGKPATQSSTLAGTPSAGVAVDGLTDGAFGDGSVTATNLDTNAWWQVDLGASYAVSSVVVWNRTDCCSSRLNDYWVFVSNTPFGATDTPATLQNRAGTFSSHQTSAPSPSTAITSGATGRYVRVQLTSPNYLSLAEVQVFGQ